jgi:hypothetical protein
MKLPKMRLSTFLLLVVVAGQSLAIGIMHLRMREMASVMDEIVASQLRIVKLETGAIPRPTGNPPPSTPIPSPQKTP